MDGRPSASAERVARARAAHQLFDDPRVFGDPLAIRILGGGADTLASEEREREQRSPLARSLRAFLAVRSRVAEDEVAAAFERGLRQYVVLGAGLDTFGYRNPFPDLQTVEVDYPSTQSSKRARLAETSIAVPASVSFVPLDFATGDLAEALARHADGRAARRIFSWLGVTPYLDGATVSAVLGSIASLAGDGADVVFDYMRPPSALDPMRRAAFDQLLQRLDAAGEPFRTFLEPSEISAELRDLGFQAVTDWGPEELNATYFSNRADGLRVGSLGHVVVARRDGSGPPRPPGSLLT